MITVIGILLFTPNIHVTKWVARSPMLIYSRVHNSCAHKRQSLQYKSIGIYSSLDYESDSCHPESLRPHIVGATTPGHSDRPGHIVFHSCCSRRVAVAAGGGMH